MKKVLLRTFITTSVITVLFSAFAAVAGPIFFGVSFSPKKSINDATYHKTLYKAAVTDRILRKKAAAINETLTSTCTEVKRVYTFGGGNAYQNTPDINTFEVPAGVTSVTIEAYGANGGDAYGAGQVYSETAETGKGGIGAYMKASYNVTTGQKFAILVGQRGGDEYWADGFGINSGGGGGGSFVFTYSGTPNFTSSELVMAAGGGGGGGYGKTRIQLNGQEENIGLNDDRDANTSRAANYGAQESDETVLGGTGGTLNGEGYSGSGGDNSGGGAGIKGYLVAPIPANAMDGLAPSAGNWGGYSSWTDLLNGVFGDADPYDYGGYGGGGATGGGGGGGGGYSGGGGGKNNGFGGGGGSYIDEASASYVGGSKNEVRRGNLANPYDATGNGTVVITYKVAKPDIKVFGNNNAISNGQTAYSINDLTEFGTTAIGSPVTHTFEIRNNGTAALSIASIGISNAANFSVSQAANSSVPVNGSTTFTVTFNPASNGLKTALVSITSNDACVPSYTFNVEGTASSTPPLTPGSIGSPQTICSGSTVLGLTSVSEATGGTGTITYQWQSSLNGTTFTDIPGAVSNSYNPGVLTVTTIYRRKALTSSETTYSNTVAITVNTTPIPTITANGPTTFCDGGSVVLTSSAATGNVWSTGATTQSITVTAAGTYGVAVTANGCSANSTGTEVTVTPKTTPTFSQVEPICAGGSFTLPATSNNGISGTWSPAINNTTTTTYTFTPSAGQCASTTTMTVVVNTTPIPTISASGSTTFCEGGSVTLTSSAATGNVWSTGATTQSIVVSASGTYGVEVTANGCSANSLGTTVTVTTKTTPTFTQVAAICAGGSFTLPNTSTNGISGTWSPAINNTTTTTYTFTPNAGQCANTTTMTVVVNSKPATPVVTVVDNCNGTSTLSTTAAGSLLWSTGSTASSISVSSAGSYTVTQSVNGCVSAAGSGVASPKTAPAAPVLSKSDECGRTLLSATAAGSILWSNGSTANDISVTVPGTYTATQSLNGCVSAAASIVAAPKQKPDAPIVSGAATICEGSPLNLTASSSAPSPVFKWYEENGGGAIYTGANFVYNDQYTNTTYTVEVISNGCVSDRTTVNVVVNSTPALVTFAVTNNCDGTSVISATNIAPGASILWSTGATTSSITVNSAGTYSATQSLSGCTSAVSNATAAPKSKPSTPVVTVVDNCNGTSTLSTTATGSLLWSTGSTAPFITVSAAGTYTVTRSVNGCVSDAGAGVAAPKTTPAAPVVTVVDNCNNTSTLSTSATGSLLWNTGATASSITVSSAGTYTVTQSVNGCVSAAGSGVATPKSAPSISVSVDGISSFCVGATKNIFVGSSDVTLVSYQWFKDGVAITGATDNNYNATESGVYTVQGTTADGCSSVSGGVTLTATAPPAVPVITVPASICEGANSSISATPGNGVWSSSNLGVVFISVDPISHTATIRGDQAGAATISYKVTDANGCFSTASQSVTVLAKPDAGSISGPAAVCVGGTVQMNATLPNGVWMINGDASISAGGVVTGNQVGAAEIYYYITDANGCQNNAYTTIQVVAPPTATITAGGATTFCPGGSVVLHANAGSGYTYQWQKNGSNINGANAADYTATSTGAYTVIVTSNSNCAATSAAVSVSADDVTAPVKPTLPNITAECSATATAPVTTDACAGNITGTTTDPLTYTTQGDHVIHWTFTDPSGNTTTADQHVIIADVTRPTIACPSNITRSATTTGSGYGAMVTYTATASDNCGTPTVTYSPASGSYFPVGTTTVTVTADDGHGNTNTCHFDVTVIAPEINITGNSVTIVDGDATPSTTDNTDFGNTLPASPIVKTFTIQNTGNDDLNVSAITISGVDAASFTVSGFNPTTLAPGASTTFNVTFAASTTGVKNATVTVSNNDFDESSYDFAITANINCSTPVFTNCPANITQPTDAGVCSAVVNYTTSVSGIPAPSLTYTFSGATTGSGSGNGSGATFNKGVTTVTITAGNGCGSVVCSFTITVEDHEIPVITNVPNNISKGNDAGQCGAVVTFTTPTFTDNCPGVTWTADHQSGDVFPIGTTTVHYTATDASGNKAYASFDVTVNDTENPTITIPSDVNHTADAGRCSYKFANSVTDINTVTPNGPTPGYGSTAILLGTATGTDNCGATTVVGVRSDGLALTDPYPVGTTTVTWTVTDSHGRTATGVQTIVITDDESPVIHNLPANITQSADLNSCGAVVNWTAPTATDNCAVTLTTNHAPGETFAIGTTVVTYKATDSHGHETTGSFNVTVTDDQAPTIACPGNITVSAEAGKNGANVTYTATATDNCGTATVTYSIAPGSLFAIGTTTVTATATDAKGNQVSCSFDVIVTNNPPVANPDVNTTTEDTPVSGNVLTNDTDIDGHTLSVTGFVINGTPYTPGQTATFTEGSLVLNADGTYTYTPAANFNGAVPVVTYSITDGHGGTASTTLTINVTPVNDAPVANPDTNTTQEDTPVSGNVLTNDSDVDGDALTVTGFVINGVPYTPGTIAIIAGIGDLVINADGSYTYTPAPNYNGPVPVVTYSITDGHGGTASSTLTINVTPVNDVPVAVNDAATVNEDAVLNATVRTNDTESGDGGNTWSVVTSTTHGTLVFNNDGTYTYTPNANFNGTDAFTYKVCDVDGDCSTATVTITVVSVNDVPVAVNDAAAVNEDAVLNATVRTNDTESGDGGNTWSVVTSTTHGTLVFNNDGTYTYTPNANFNGTDAFTYKVCDVDGDCSTATVTITVVSVNDVPVAVNDAATVNEDAVLNATVRTNDTESGDGGNTWSVVTSTTHGTLVFNNDGTYTYTPNANFNGTDAFTYKVCDVDGDCSTATVTITVVSVNDVPVAANDAATVNEDAVLNATVRTNDTESGDGGNTWSVVTSTTHGTLVFNNDGTYTYTPNANFNGTDAFTYKVCDVDGDCSTATVTITVVSVNDMPVAVNDAATVNEDAVLNATVRTNDTESGDGGNTWSVVTSTTHGTLVFNNDGTYTYTPNANFNGTDAFTYKVCDVDGDCSTATVTITVVSVNDVPVAVNDAATTNEDVVLNGSVTGNDTPSPDGGNVWSLVSTTTHGTLVFNNDGTYTYTPNANFHGTDAFTYKLCDVDGDCVTATVTITVVSVDDPAVMKVKNITVYVDANGHVSITAGQIDDGSYDPDGIASLTLDRTEFSCGDIATSPNTVTLTLVDGEGNSTSANATVTVLDVIPPTISCPAPVTVQCAASVPAPNVASVTAADNCAVVVSFVNDVISNQVAPNKYTITRTYKAVDPSGNTAYCSQLITVNDNTAPTLIVANSLPGNTTGQCLGDVPAAPTAASIAALYTDNCSGAVTAVLSNTTTTGTNATGWTRKYYYTITDASGNSTTACVTYSGRDTQAPVPTVATLPTVTGQCAASVTAPTATDNCAGTITATTTSPLSYTAQGTYTITWTYSDGNGNTSTQTQTVVVKDNIKPMINCPSDITLTANTTVSGQAGANVTYSVTATDNCGTPSITYSKASGSFFPVGTTVVTATADDGNGNTATCSFKVIVNCTAPSFTTCPSNITKNTDAGLCSAVVTYSSASTAIPNASCSYTFTGATTGSGSGNGSGKVFNKGVTNVTITATNLCGTTTCNFTVTVVDNEKPRITAPSAVSVVNDAGKCGATIASIGNAVTSDNCGVASVTNNHPSTYYPVGKTIVTWTVTDVNGNVTDTAKQCITVIDNEVPTISATNVTVGSTAGLCGANLTLAAPVTGDNCGVASVTNDHPSTFFPVGTTTVTWTVTDNAGWTNTTKQTVTVTDAEKPVITCPGNVTIACGLAPTPANAGTAAAVDNCGGAVTITYTDVVNGNTTQRTWKATDAAGNFSTCVQTITVGGPFAASITSVPTSNVYTGGTANSLFIGYGAQSTVLQTNVPAGTYTYAWSGADVAMLSNTNTANPTFTPTHGGSYNFTVTVTNALGCVTTASVSICVTDIRVFATATVPSNNNNCSHQSHYFWNCPHSGHGHSCTHSSHSSYNCPDKEDSDDHQVMCNHQSHNASECPHKGHNHSCDHRSHTSYKCAHRDCNDRDDDDDHQRTCDHKAHSSYDCSHRGHNHANCNHQAHYSWNCPHSSNSGSDQKVCNHQSHSSGDCNHSGHNHGSCNHKSHSASDCPHNGNGGTGGTDDDDEKKVYICHVPPGNPSQRQTLSIGVSAVASHLANHPGDRLGSCDQAPCTGYTDNVKPTIDCSDNVTIAYGSSTSPVATGSPEADDNSGDVVITYSDASTKGTNASAASYYNYVITRTWKATDLAGNYATCVQTITVQETTKPVITCPGNTTVACGSTAPEVTGTATATDNSGVVSVTYTDAVSGNKTTRTWKATDPSGNYVTCVQTITVIDNVKPVITAAADVTVNCGSSTAPAATGTATASDNCSSVTLTYSDAWTGSYKLTRTWKATDASGNYATDVQVITIVDNVKPTITAPADKSISCGSSTAPNYCGGSATASDNCSSVTITYSDVTNGNVITRTWKATDASGNYATDAQLITVIDNVKPVISDVRDVTISCGTSTTPQGCGSVATATDNCSTPVVTYSDVTVGNKITRTWTATDAAGNTATSTQIITIVDNTKPVISDVADRTVSCGSTDPSITGTATATDACSTPVVTYSDVQSGNKITRTWKATDAAGNYATSTQVITITDNVKPVITAPSDITVSCSSLTAPANTGSAVANDACSVPTVTYTDAQSGNKITRTWKATDASGNYATAVQVINVVDNVKPTITAPADKLISCGSSTAPSYCGGSATATDNCSSVSISYSDVTNGNVITRTWKATDASGNYATDVQLITIIDNVKPVISDVRDVTISCGQSTTPQGCGSVATATDNCSTPVVTYSDVTVGNKITRTWTATDAAGNTATSTQIITIVDNTKPVLTEPNDITINCGGSTAPSATGMATATDGCSTPVITYTDVQNGNVITRTWKATDAAGNYITDVQYITIGSSFTASITSAPTNSTYTGGVSTNLYLGYGAQSTTLTLCSLPSAGAPYTYVWNGGSYANRLSSTTSASPLFTPATSGYYTFTVTVTNKYGCTSVASISICVTDIRVPGTNGAKVYVCHTPYGKNKTPQTLQVPINQVSSHLNTSSCGSDGYDRLGSCDQTPCNTTVVNTTIAGTTTVTKEAGEQVNTTEEDLKVTVMPNPSTTYFTLKLESKYDQPVNLRVMDANGRVVDAKTKIGSNSSIQIGHNYASGTYYAELIQGTKRKVVQLIKARG